MDLDLESQMKLTFVIKKKTGQIFGIADLMIDKRRVMDTCDGGTGLTGRRSHLAASDSTKRRLDT